MFSLPDTLALSVADAALCDQLRSAHAPARAGVLVLGDSADLAAQVAELDSLLGGSGDAAAWQTALAAASHPIVPPSGSVLPAVRRVREGGQSTAERRRAAAAGTLASDCEILYVVGGAGPTDLAPEAAAPWTPAQAWAVGVLEGAAHLEVFPQRTTPKRVVFFGAHYPDDLVAQARTWARSVGLARALANTPSNRKNPVWFAERVQELAGHWDTVRVSVADETQLAALGCGGLLAVGGGSQTPPRLVTVQYTPRTRGKVPTVALVGKGITFDTGGISLKPGEAMAMQTTDMSGAAACLAATLALAELQVPVQVVAVLALAENQFAGGSYRPSDVLQLHDGTTVEVVNTDAEGRLVLADALSYARATFRPDYLIDIATLTGAATLGLGRYHAAAYTRDDALAALASQVGEACGDQVWRLPLAAAYTPALDSPVADLAHAERERHFGAGSITAALFLERFGGQVPHWLHLDIAGPGRNGGQETAVPKNRGTGFGAVLLTALTQALAARH